MHSFPKVTYTKQDLLKNYWGYVDESIKKFGSKEFIITRHGVMTFFEVNSISNQICRQIKQQYGFRGIGVGLFMQDPREVIPCLMGVLKSNNYFVVMDVTFPATVILSMIQTAEIKIILTSHQYLKDIQSITGNSILILCIDKFDSTLMIENTRVEFSPDDIVQIMFTSGSTGKPKGAIEDYRYLIRAVMTKLTTYEFDFNDKVLQLSSFNYSGPHSHVLAALLIGFSICYHKVKDEGYLHLPSWIKEQGITIYTSTPTTFRGLVTSLKPEDTFPSVRIFYEGGEKRFRNDMQAVKLHFPNIKNIRLNYSGTEMQSVTSSMVPVDIALQKDNLPSGKPYDGVEVFIWDTEGNPLPQGQEGEIVIYSDALARGYMNEPELTRLKFIQDKNNPDWQYFKTGDLGMILPDGELMHLGRLDNMVKIRGIRIEVNNIESLISSLPGVVQVASKVFSDSIGTKKLATYYTLHEGSYLPSHEIRKYLAEHLPAQQIPNFIIKLDKMPFTVTGKVSYEQLPEPSIVRPEFGFPPVVPTSKTEQELLRIWEEQIGIHGIGVTDNFFDLGGDSLTGVLLFEAIENTFRKEFSIGNLLRAPTIRELGKVVDGTAQSEKISWIISINPKGTKPPMFFVPGKGGYPTRIWHLAKRMDPEVPIYAFQNTVKLSETARQHTVVTLARQYLAEMKTLYPIGPFLLVGESMGGKIVYEIAQQLVRVGDPPPIVFLLDTYNIGSVHKLNSPNARWSYFQMLVKKHASILFKADWQGKKEYLKFYLGLFLPKVSELVKHSKKKTVKKSNYALPDTYTQIENANTKISQEYKVKPYPGQVILVKALRGIRDNVIVNGWGDVGIKELVVEDLDCYHGSMLFEPAVSQLAIIIQSHIDNQKKEFSINANNI